MENVLNELPVNDKIFYRKYDNPKFIGEITDDGSVIINLNNPKFDEYADEIAWFMERYNDDDIQVTKEVVKIEELRRQKIKHQPKQLSMLEQPKNNLIINQFCGKQVRTIVIGNAPHWIAKEVCDILGLSNSRKALLPLKEGQQKLSIDYQTMQRLSVTKSDGQKGGARSMTLLTEAGLYKLVFKSNKPEAEKFTDWIAEEVLPQIRQTGTYSIDKF